MNSFIKKIGDNVVINTIFNLIYRLIFFAVLIMLIIVVLQKVSNNRLSLMGYRMFTIVTDSMAPKYEIGDVLLAEHVDISELKVGDDIAYIGKEGDFKDKVITHQIVDIKEENGRYTISAKGSGNAEEDPKISGEQVYGKIIHKFLILSFLCKIIRNIYAFYFIVFVPIGIIIFDQIRSIVKKKRK